LQLQAKNPAGIGTVNVEIIEKETDILCKHGPERRLYDIASAGEVLREPLVIFENLRREGFEKGLCYSGKPKIFGQQWEMPTENGMIFAVYINCDKIVYEWRLEKEDVKYSGHPAEWKRRFGTKIWTR
jgi:hypothetical protein